MSVQQILLAFGGSSHTSIIDSIQAFSITIAAASNTGTATITAVDTARSIIVWDGWQATGSTNYGVGAAHLTLTATTTVTATRGANNGTDTVTVKGVVVQFIAAVIQSTQTGTSTIGSAATTHNNTISAITTANAGIFLNGWTASSSVTTSNSFWPYVQITSTTQITSTRPTATTTSCTSAYSVLEFASGKLNSSTQAATLTVSNGNSTGTSTLGTAVTLAQSMVAHGGMGLPNSGTNVANLTHISLTGTTTVTGTSNSTSGDRVGAFTVFEFKTADINNCQRGTTQIANTNSTADATITAVVTAKTIPVHLNAIMSATTTGTNALTNDFLNSTTVMRMSRDGTSSVLPTASWEAIEFT